MKHFLTTMTLLLCLCTLAFGQIGKNLLDRAKRTAEQKTKQVFRDKKDSFLDDMQAARDEFDASNFNYAIALSDNAALFENEEKFGKHKQALLRAAQSADSRGELPPAERAKDANNMGETFYASNRFRLAELSFKNAKRLFEESSGTADPVYAQVLSNLGLLYHTTGRYGLAEEYTKAGMTLNQMGQFSDPAPFGASLNNLAVLYKDLGRYQEALELMEESLEKTADALGESSLPYAIGLNNEALVYQALGQYDEARDRMAAALETAGGHLKEKSGNYVRLMVNMAMVYQDMQRYGEAKETYLQAKALLDKRLGKRHPDYANLLNNMASLYFETGEDDEQTAALLNEAASIYKAKFGENHPSYAATLSNLGNFYRAKGKLAEARPLLEKALEAKKQSLPPKHPAMLAAYEDMALLLWQEGVLNKAGITYAAVLDQYLSLVLEQFPAMSDYEKEKFWDKFSHKTHAFASLVNEASAQNPALATSLYKLRLNTKGLLLNATNKVRMQILNSGDEKLTGSYLAWLDQKEQLARAYTLSQEQIKEENISIDSLERAANGLEKALSVQSEAFSSAYVPEPADMDAVMGSLAEGEAAVELIRVQRFDRVLTAESFYLALVLLPGKQHPLVVELPEGNYLDGDGYQAYKNLMGMKMEDTGSYETYWEPIDKALGTNVKTVFFSPDGIYQQVNPATLYLPNGKTVLDTKLVRMVSNTRYITALKAQAKQKPTGSVLLLGFPDYGPDGKIVPLPGTEKEINKIALLAAGQKLSVNKLLAGEATEASIKAAKNPSVLHIATHGFFLPDISNRQQKVFGVSPSKARENPLLRSGLMLAGAEASMGGSQLGQPADNDNGVLTAYEAMNLQLNNTEIVILSACETGLGDIKHGEGVYGLQRAFQVAGAGSIIMSLWKVSDEDTQALMGHFYQEWLKSGDKSTAFRNAQLALKKKAPHPYFWGAFVMLEK